MSYCDPRKLVGRNRNFLRKILNEAKQNRKYQCKNPENGPQKRTILMTILITIACAIIKSVFGYLTYQQIWPKIAYEHWFNCSLSVWKRQYWYNDFVFFFSLKKSSMDKHRQWAMPIRCRRSFYENKNANQGLFQSIQISYFKRKKINFNYSLKLLPMSVSY